MKVVLHKSTDGVLHESAKACAKREVELRVLPAAQALVDRTVGQFDTLVDVGEVLFARPVDDTGDCVASWIASNADALRKLLNEALIAKRPRKAKKLPVVPASISGLTLVAA